MNDKKMTTAEQMAYMQKLAAYYNEKGEDALTEDIMKSIREEKAAGRLNNEMIVNMATLVARFASPEQKKKLEVLVQTILDENQPCE